MSMLIKTKRMLYEYVVEDANGRFARVAIYDMEWVPPRMNLPFAVSNYARTCYCVTTGAWVKRTFFMSLRRTTFADYVREKRIDVDSLPLAAPKFIGMDNSTIEYYSAAENSFYCGAALIAH